MSEFKKGQLVAVRDNADGRWSLWIYDHASPEGLHFCRSPNHMIGPRWWRYAAPAENVWPNIFLGWERRAREQSDHAVEVQRLRRQIGWLCQELARVRVICPSLSVIASCDNECASCWEQASLKAVKDDKDE